VLWAVWSEVRQPTRSSQVPVHAGGRGTDDPTAVSERPGRRRAAAKPTKGRGGRVARLVVLEPKSARGTAYALAGEITIGRDPGCTISTPDDTFVSTLHARIFDHDGQPMVEDLNSTNGSFHNGNKLVGARLLHPGDRVQFGHTVLEAQ
jgi:pSer/pThr/pTyr-binding forkhead associated (FHA) protein